MNREEQILHYNYSNFDGPTLKGLFSRFQNQVELGKKGPDFPMWQLTDDPNNPLAEPTTLMAQIEKNKLTVVEFGSLT